MEQRAIAIAVVVLTAVSAGGIGAAVRYRRAHADARGKPHSAAVVPAPAAFAGDADVHVPAGVRVKVEVLNTTHVRGLARRATFYLRDRGFDVVDLGTTAGERDSTVVLDRSRHPDWARLAARALGRARVDERPDSSRYVDLTVLLGATWRPPPQPFYP